METVGFCHATVVLTSEISVWNRHISVGDSMRVPSCEHSVGSEIFVFFYKLSCLQQHPPHTQTPSTCTPMHHTWGMREHLAPTGSRVLGSEDWLVYAIQVLELYPILLLVATFAEKMGGSHIVFHTDNQAIVAVLNKQTSKCPRIMAILRSLVLLLLLQHHT